MIICQLKFLSHSILTYGDVSCIIFIVRINPCTLNSVGGILGHSQLNAVFTSLKLLHALNTASIQAERSFIDGNHTTVVIFHIYLHWYSILPLWTPLH